MDQYLLHSALLNFGVTQAGAFQFMQGLPVVSQEDRNALRAMFLGLTKSPPKPIRGGGMFRSAIQDDPF
jgi:hypothetical protein